MLDEATISDHKVMLSPHGVRSKANKTLVIPRLASQGPIERGQGLPCQKTKEAASGGIIYRGEVNIEMIQEGSFLN